MRIDNRQNDELRKVTIQRNYLLYPNGSVLIKVGNTAVLCTVSIEDKVPHFLKGTEKGWLTCEYSMLPGSTHSRKMRDSTRGKIDGRSQEIQRLIGRSLRTSIDLSKIGERTIWIDCDVLQADGGTRTASITGAFVAMYEAVYKLFKDGLITEFPVKDFVAATSIGKIGEELILDLNYEEDSSAEVDMNVVMNERGQFIEVQGTGEEALFSKTELFEMVDLAEKGIKTLIEKQKDALIDIRMELELDEENCISNE
ncbi:MAG: ribonuclease PH [Tissierellia bacterium]|nr:ribonuclease PH [Tissierellia bacterium]